MAIFTTGRLLNNGNKAENEAADRKDCDIFSVEHDCIHIFLKIREEEYAAEGADC